MAEHTAAEAPEEGRNWPRITGYIVAVILWLALGAGRIDEWLAGIFLVAVVRGLYVFAMRRWSTPRRFLTPWLFVAAALLEVVSLAGQRG